MTFQDPIKLNHDRHRQLLWSSSVLSCTTSRVSTCCTSRRPPITRWTGSRIAFAKHSGNMKMLPFDAVNSALRSSMSASAMKHRPQHSMHRCFCPSNGRQGRWTGQIGHAVCEDNGSCQNRQKHSSGLHAVQFCMHLRAEIFLPALA